MDKIGTKLEKLRKINGVSMQRICEFLNITENEYKKQLKNIDTMSLQDFESLCMLYGVSMADMYESDLQGYKTSTLLNDVSVKDMRWLVLFREIVNNYQKMDEQLQ